MAQASPYLMKFVRLAGLAVIFAYGLGSGAQPVNAGKACRDYTMQTCMNADSCFEVAGASCGSQAGNQCAGEGVVACGLGSGCGGEDAKVTMVCDFEEE